jgi:hypothetical protein
MKKIGTKRLFGKQHLRNLKEFRLFWDKAVKENSLEE